MNARNIPIFTRHNDSQMQSSRESYRHRRRRTLSSLWRHNGLEMKTQVEHNPQTRFENMYECMGHGDYYIFLSIIEG